MRTIGRTVAVIATVSLLTFAVLVPSAAADSAARPFHGTVAGTADVAPDASCPIGLRTVSVATGQLTHVGLATVTMGHCTPNPPFGPAPGPIVGGEITIVAANGDVLVGTYAGTVEAIEPVEGAAIRGLVHVAFTGGSGRFADAEGGATVRFWGTLHLATPMSATWAFDGVIGY
jgi:hypothetical protein